MKKVFLFSVLVIFFAGMVLGSVRHKFNDTEIMEMIERSKGFNPEVSNPNRIYPGQVLTFLFEDGTEKSVLVEDGDSQWTIIEQKVSAFIADHGAVIHYPKEDNKGDEAQANVINPIMDFNPFLWFMIIMLGIILQFAIFKFFEYGKKSSKENPVTAGPPQIEGGVKDDQIRSVIQSRYPNCTILSIEKGRLYGKGVPYYNFSRVSLKSVANNVFGKSFNGEVGYQAEIINPSGQKMLVQTLAGCGNEIKMNGNFMTGLTFIKDGEQPEVLIKEPTKSEETKTEKTNQNEVLVDTELLKVASEHDILAGEFLKATNAHKVTLRVTLPNGSSIETILETKNQPKEIDLKKEDQK